MVAGLFVEIESARNSEIDALFKAGWWVTDQAVDPECCFELRRGAHSRIRVVVSHPTDLDERGTAVERRREPRSRGPEVCETDEMVGLENTKFQERAAAVEVLESAVAFGFVIFHVEVAGKGHLDGVAIRRLGHVAQAGNATESFGERVAGVDVELCHLLLGPRFCRAAQERQRKEQREGQPE